MCNIYNPIGSLTSLKSHLERNDIHDFRSLRDVIDFQNSYPVRRQQIISHHEDSIEEEGNLLYSETQELARSIEEHKSRSETELNDRVNTLRQRLSALQPSAATNYFRRFIVHFERFYYLVKIKYSEQSMSFRARRSLNKQLALRQVKEKRYEYIISQFDDAVRQSCQSSLSELDRKKSIIDELKPFIYGALGEEKVVRTLELLPDEYHLINDFRVSFAKPVYNRQENDYIRSVQIDHILVGPSGVFIIETKNWSEISMADWSLYSPVRQIRRAGLALFRLLNNETAHYYLHVDRHHWGNRKIPIKNIVVFMNKRPREEWQYVKVLTLSELISYLDYFSPVFSEVETQRIANYLLDLNNRQL